MDHGVTSIKVIYKKSLKTLKNKSKKIFRNDLRRGYPSLKSLMERENMREKAIEKKLVQEVKAVGGIAPKFTSPGFDGMPDRIVLLPGGHMAFVEAKAPGEKPRPLQLARHRLLRWLGFRVYVLDDERQIGGILDEIRTT